MSKIERKTNNITCGNCKYSIATGPSCRVWLCDNPHLKSFGKNVKHGTRFSCGYGLDWRKSGEASDAGN